MWHRLKNFFSSLRTYDALSPDLKVRRRVNQSLRDRPDLSLDAWYESLYKAQGIAYPVADFAYHRLKHYSGLELGRALPTDRLNEDLCWSQVCWFDWELNLADDFQQQFGIDISHCLNEVSLTTIEDLVSFLNAEWVTHGAQIRD
jgi:hypothetical protein